MTLRIVAYARVSTADAEKQDPETQLSSLRPWCAQKGWTLVAEEADRVTGDPTRRKGDPPGLRRAVRLIEDRKADGIAVFAADRLVRSPLELIAFVNRVRSLGGHVVSYTDGSDLDTTADTGELMLYLNGWMSRMFLRLLRQRTKAGIERARAAGKRLGRPPKADPTSVLELRSAGLSWTAIAAKLGVTVSAARGAAARGATAGGADPPAKKGDADRALVSVEKEVRK